MAISSAFNTVTSHTGRWFLSKIIRVLDQAAFFWDCIRVFFRYRTTGRRLMSRILVEQIYFTGVQSIELVAFVALVSGALLALSSISLLEMVGSLDGLGMILIASIVREAGPILTALIIILRSGSAIAMEIGYMNVLGEMEGLEMQGIPVIHFLCIPRLIGVTVSVMCLMIFFAIIATFGGLLASWTILDITAWKYYYNISIALKRTDFLLILAKGLCFGTMIPVVCMFDGFKASNAITNVPPRVSRALVDCLIYLVILNIIITVAFTML